MKPGRVWAPSRPPCRLQPAAAWNPIDSHGQARSSSEHALSYRADYTLTPAGRLRQIKLRINPDQSDLLVYPRGTLRYTWRSDRVGMNQNENQQNKTSAKSVQSSPGLCVAFTPATPLVRTVECMLLYVLAHENRA